METNGSREEFVDHLGKLVDFAFGRRCLHEFRCGCYPTMQYRRKTGWKLVTECVTCPFCNMEEEEVETSEHLLRTYPSWRKERVDHLGDYLMFGEDLMLKIVLGHRYSIEEQALVNVAGLDDSKVVVDICCFLQKVDLRRSTHLKSKGWDITDRRSTRGGGRGLRGGRKYESVIRHSEEGAMRLRD